ncbi:MAG: hypothetical protein H8D67_14100 [Deltaproteobacteria bacterium]|nr:hypothetical protein [Deltaproteobacteria bacterium]
MQPITKEELKRIIEEAKAVGKDVSELEKMLSGHGEIEDFWGKLIEEEKAAGKDTSMLEKKPVERGFPKPPMGEIKKKETEKGVVVIVSTGPAREEDFGFRNSELKKIPSAFRSSLSPLPFCPLAPLREQKHAEVSF